MPLLRNVLFLAVAGAATALPAHAAGSDRIMLADLTDLTLEQLSDIDITSVWKKAEPLARAAASVFVITGEDIRRSGATTLPEALRLAPNLQVARENARNYAITARGFNGVFANKMLVMIDGRTVYSPLFSGVFWDAQDVLLEDVDRIEVISGPGGTTWGVNAVNGVINIITRSAADTQGTLATAGASSEERIGAARYGGTLANGGHYRVYGKYIARDDTDSTNVLGSSFDGWHRSQAGFRADWGRGESRTTLQGDAYQGWLHQFGTSDIRIAGANLLGRMNDTLANGSHLRLQAYWDHTERDQPNAFREHLDTFDLDGQNTLQIGDRHEFTWGGGYRYALDRVENDQNFAFLPGAQNLYWANLFAQDEIRLLESLRLTAGLKLERNNYTGTESLPTLRLSWEPAQNHVFWGAVSRAARAPSRIDRDFYVPSSPSVVNGVPQYAVAGGPDFASETLRSVEAGYRGQLGGVVSYSITAFYGKYDDLRTLQINQAGPGTVFTNQAAGSSRGIESWATWQAAQSWRLSAGLVAQHIDVHVKPGQTVLNAGALASDDPGTYWSLRSAWDLTSRQQLDLTLRHVAALPNPAVPAYTEMDMRFGWKLDRNLDLDLIGQNLLHASHAEFDPAIARSEYPRTVFVRLTWRY